MKDVSDQQVAEHLKRLNPWWGGTNEDPVTLGLRPRAYLEPVQALLRESGLRRAVVLLGRQWPAAVLTFHYGVRAVRGRLATHAAAVKGIEA